MPAAFRERVRARIAAKQALAHPARQAVTETTQVVVVGAGEQHHQELNQCCDCDGVAGQGGQDGKNHHIHESNPQLRVGEIGLILISHLCTSL